MAAHFGNVKGPFGILPSEGQFAQFMLNHPKTNAAITLFEEQFNPLAVGEGVVGGMAGRALAGNKAVRGVGAAAAHATGFGSPMSKIYERGGDEAKQWYEGLIATTNHADGTARKAMQHVFGDLTPAEQNEVVRLSQGLAPDPQFFRISGDLTRRANALRSDIAHVTNEKVRVGRLRETTTKTVNVPQQPMGGMKVPPRPTTVVDKAGNVYDRATYFPMSHSRELSEREELVAQLKGFTSRPGGGDTARRHKTRGTFDDWIAAKDLDPDFSAARNYETWRRQGMQQVAFEEAMARAPQSMRIASTPAARKALARGGGEINGLKYEHVADIVPDANRVLRSPTLRRSLLAPELFETFADGSFAKHIDRAGMSGVVDGKPISNWAKRFIGLSRNLMLSNFAFHPGVNVAGNDAAARGLHNLGGPAFEVGGYAYNSAKALALQAGLVKPEQFVGGAKQYAEWADRALKAGGLAEFGTPRESALGGDAARVLTERIEGGAAPKTWVRRLDKAMTRFNEFNRERTFGSKGEGAFAVSLFKDAVQKGRMPDAKAAALVRQALADYYDMDPHSKLPAAFYFMPWLKANSKNWVNLLVSKPQYTTATQHAIRDYNQQTGDPAMDPSNPFPAPDFRIHTGGADEPSYRTPPFVGRIGAELLNAAGSAKDGPMGPPMALDRILEGRANPLTRGGLDTLYTIYKGADGKDVVGPETDFHAIVNVKAPAHVQFEQLGRYVIGHGVPIPLFTYAWQDAMRRGISPKDLYSALLTASGAGFGSEGTTAQQRRVVNRAKKTYLRAFNAWRYRAHNDSRLERAWSRYMDQLRHAGAIN
jgi:hypothetical protein